MEYNTLRSKLIIPEYGRHIQQMVDHCLTIQDEQEKNEFAEIIIEVMGELNPHLRDVPDFQHKLWDQLFIMSDFQLDVKSPYPIPTKKDTIDSKPNKVDYPNSIYKYRYYGSNIRKMITVANTWEQGEKREGLCFAIANHMKKCYLKWNKETVEDRVIFEHLFELSQGEIDLRDVEEALVKPDYTSHSSHTPQNRTYSQNQVRNTNHTQQNRPTSNQNRQTVPNHINKNNNTRNPNIRNNNKG